MFTGSDTKHSSLSQQLLFFVPDRYYKLLCVLRHVLHSTVTAWTPCFRDTTDNVSE